MLPAKPNPLVIAWFDGWCRRALRKHFNRVHVVDADAGTGGRALVVKPPFDPGVPRLYVANHSSFWDGILLFHLVRRHRPQPLYCMSGAKQVAEHPFFRRVGSFTVDRDDPRDRVAAVRHGADLLSRPARPPALIMFPQGRIRPNDDRPLALEPGFAHVLERAPMARIVPVALRYEFWEEQRAEAMIHLGEERTWMFDRDHYDRAELIEWTRRQLEAGLDELRRRGRAFEPGRVILQGERSISHWKDRFKARADT